MVTRHIFNNVEEINEYLNDLEYILDEGEITDYEVVVMFDMFRDILLSDFLNDDIDKYIVYLKSKYYKLKSTKI
jgi:hypothetical protein